MYTRTIFNNGFDEFHIIDYMPRYQKKKRVITLHQKLPESLSTLKATPK